MCEEKSKMCEEQLYFTKELMNGFTLNRGKKIIFTRMNDSARMTFLELKRYMYLS